LDLPNLSIQSNHAKNHPITMARRSLAKRLVRIAQNLQKKTIRLGTRVENKFTTWTHEIAGPEIVASVQGCAEK
jgi:hypothetical protein